MQEKIKELFSDEKFVNTLCAQESYEAAAQLFVENDVDVSAEDLKEIVRIIKEHPDGKLTEDELEGVSGGSPDVIVSLALLGIGITVLVRKEGGC